MSVLLANATACWLTVPALPPTAPLHHLRLPQVRAGAEYQRPSSAAGGGAGAGPAGAGAAGGSGVSASSAAARCCCRRLAAAAATLCFGLPAAPPPTCPACPRGTAPSLFHPLAAMGRWMVSCSRRCSRTTGRPSRSCRVRGLGWAGLGCRWVGCSGCARKEGRTHAPAPAPYPHKLSTHRHSCTCTHPCSLGRALLPDQRRRRPHRRAIRCAVRCRLRRCMLACWLAGSSVARSACLTLVLPPPAHPPAPAGAQPAEKFQEAVRRALKEADSISGGGAQACSASDGCC